MVLTTFYYEYIMFKIDVSKMRWLTKEQRKIILKGKSNIIIMKVSKLKEYTMKDKVKVLFQNKMFKKEA